ncbi:hypothetical protein IP92_04320 [Pseudoduganella flava]|uniref:DUF2987 domain-containing protein n=1 Tax=Pseudoduganella flava TaxID=871742 RepID=A0A562PIU5_9BURK|nr:hypothetical protein [Pseudoduganella flava]QGZ41956.1 hypothetical protein GO485_24840 [Pseudoduganella flava]TWI44371.1 hypothetical protein IP92_04320 [Pseudoduganella flava]
MKTALPLLSLLSLLALQGMALAETEREWVPYKKLVDVSRLDKFYALPAAERDKLDMYVHLTPSSKDVDVRTVQLTAVHSGGRTALPVDGEGNLRVGLNPKWLAEDVKIMTNQPKESKVAVSPGMNAIVPPGKEWQYAALMGSVAQSNAAIGKMAGALSMFAPTVRSVVLKFDQPAQVTIQAKAGTKQYMTDAKQQIRLKPDAALLAENPAMTVSVRPREAELDSE